MSFERYAPFRANPSLWLPIAADIARSHRLPSVNVQPFENGTNLVLALDETLILKIFPPMLRGHLNGLRSCNSMGAWGFRCPSGWSKANETVGRTWR